MCVFTVGGPDEDTVSAVRYVAAVLADRGAHPLARLEITELLERPELEPFREAGALSVEACLACDADLNFYLTALLRSSAGPDGPDGA